MKSVSGQYNYHVLYHIHLSLYFQHNFNQAIVNRKAKEHDPHSTLLVGKLTEQDKVYERKVASLIDNSPLLFGK